MGINSTEVSYNFGQLGSMFISGSVTAKPPTGMVFVAITFLTDTSFDTTDGLVADNDSDNGLEYIGSVFARDTDGSVDDAAHDEATPTATLGQGGVAVEITHVFPKGVTIYGRWTEIDLNSTSTLIAYLGR
tara:strand:+ start:22 stop:414 length:393 start_codon:yes stop_codon:yes gene_type:complete